MNFSNEAFIDSKPELTRKFKQASLKGWRYAFSHIDESVEIILDKYNTQNRTREALAFEANQLKKLAFDEHGEFGKISERKIAGIAQIYLIIGLIDKSYDLSGFIYRDGIDDLILNQEELSYLSNKKAITMCIDPDWMPYEKIENGRHVGMTSDYMALFSKRLGLPIKLVPTQSWQETLESARKGKCEIISAAMITPDRLRYLNFTETYMSMPLVIATSNDTLFINDIQDILDKKLGVVRGYAFSELLKQRYPGIHLVDVDNDLDGLLRVEKGELYGFIDSIAPISYTLQKHHMIDLKVGGTINDHWNISIAVHKDDPILLGLLNKAIISLDKSDHQDILNKWISIKYEQGFDYQLFWWILPVVGVLFLGLVFRNFFISKYNRKLELIASTDKLTQIYNRYKLDSTLNQQMTISSRYERPFALVMFDIDLFKQVNDQYGHKTGDNVLVELVSIVRSHIRKSDTFGRWGGEEFLLILPETDIENARDSAEKLRDKISRHRFSIVGSLTCSFGISAFEPEDTMDTLIIRADKALYRAKKLGRDKVEILSL